MSEDVLRTPCSVKAAEQCPFAAMDLAEIDAGIPPQIL
jgi:hypothetical protein